MGPAIYIYLKTILNQSISLQLQKIWLHILPLIPATAFMCYFISFPADIRTHKLIESFDTAMWQVSVLNGIFYIQMTSYLIACYRIVNKQIKKSRIIQKGSVLIDIYWLKTYFIIDIAIMFSTLPIVFVFNNERVNVLVSLIAMIIQFVYIFIKSAWQTSFASGDTLPTQKQHAPKLIIEAPVADSYLLVLKEYFHKNKPYINQECTINDISKATKIPLHHISNILNKHLSKNFNNFVNEYRVEEAKVHLTNSNKPVLTIEAIGFDCGFGSKASFNRAFKKHTNFTPSQYRKANNN